MHRIFYLTSTLASIHNLISPQAPIVDDTLNDDISQCNGKKYIPV